MMNSLLFKRKAVAKFDYEITFHHVMKLPKSGILLYVTWNRGKKHTGETKKTFVKDKIAFWEETFKFRGTLFKNAKGKFKKKFVVLTFHEVVKERKNSKIGELKINLADFSSQQNENHSSTKTIGVTLWSNCDAQFKFTVKSSLRAGNSNGLDTLLSENTTMTEISDDEGDDENPFDDDAPVKSSPLKQQLKQPKAQQSLALKLQAKRRNEALRKLNDPRFAALGAAEEEDGLSDDDTEEDISSNRSSTSTRSSASSANSNNGSVGTPNGTPAFDKRKIARLRRTNGARRRQDNESFSLDDDADPFTAAISKVEAKSPKNAESDDAKSDDTKSDETDPVRDAVVQKAKDKITKQEQKMKQMQDEIARLQQETNERSVLDSLINNRQPEFSEGLPLAAPILFKVLQHWDSFTNTKSDFATKIYNTIRVVIENNSDNNDLLAYWLSNSCTILNLLQKEYPVSLDNDLRTDEHASIRVTIPTDPNVTNQPQATSPQSTSSGTVGDTDEFAFESPISRFRNEILNIAVKIYTHLVENIYKSLIPVLVPAMFSAPPANSSRSLEPRAIVTVLSEYHKHLSKNLVPKDITTQFFDQVYFFINAHSFNALFDPVGKRCKMGSAIMLKMAVSELEMWADGKQMAKCRDNLTALRQSSDIMIMNKASLVDESTRREVCPTLTLIQVRKVLQLYQPDEYDPDTVPSSVLKALPTPSESQRRGSTIEKPEVEEGMLHRPVFDLDNEVINWKKVKPPRSLSCQEVFEFLNC